MKRKSSRFIAWLLSLLLVFSTFTESVRADVLDEPSSASVTEWDQTTTEKVYVTDRAVIKYVLSGVWNGGYNALVSITNTSSETIENWKLITDIDNTVSNIWNAVIVSRENGMCIIGNADWNKNIYPGQTCEFGMSGNNDFRGFPTSFSFVGQKGNVPESVVSTAYTLVNDWGTGFTGKVELTNNGNATIENWVAEFEFDREITNIWNAEIISHTDNDYIVKNVAYNANIYPGTSVDFGFNGENGTADNLPQNIRITSDTVSSLQPEITGTPVSPEIPENPDVVADTLEIIYAEGDSDLYVTQNIALPTLVNNVPVTWQSSDADIVQLDGTITRPYDESMWITLTATMGDTVKEFIIRVVKADYMYYTMDDVYVLDVFEDLLLYNDDIDAVSLYLNDDGNISTFVGNISDISVETPDQAYMALYGIKNLLGIESVEEELELENVSSGSTFITYQFIQKYKGLKVDGGMLTLNTDFNGTVTSLSNRLVNVKTDIVPQLSAEDVMSAYNNNVTIIASELVINAYADDCPLVWSIMYKTPNGDTQVRYFDANTGTCISNDYGMNAVKCTAKDENNVNQTFYATLTEELDYLDKNEAAALDKYAFVTSFDDGVSITIHPYYSSESSSIVYTNILSSSDPNTWPADAVSAYANIYKAYKFFKNEIGQAGYNDEKDIDIIVGGKDNDPDNAAWTQSGYDEYIVFGHIPGDKSWGSDPIIATHEYGHAINSYIGNLPSGSGLVPSIYFDSLHEGYADTWAYLANNDNAWEFYHPSKAGSTVKSTKLRDSKNSIKYYSGMFEQEQANGNDGHYCGLVFSHAFYLMKKNGLGGDDLIHLVENSLRKGYSSAYNSFNKQDGSTLFAENVIASASELGFNTQKMNIVDSALVDTGFKPSITYVFYEIHDNTMTGKVVAVNPDSIKSQNDDVALDGVNVSLMRNNKVVSTTTTDEDGMYSFNDIVTGNYQIVFIKSGYITTTMYVTVKTSTNNYNDITYMIPSKYLTATGGYAEGKVKNAVNGSGVASQKMFIFRGINNSNAKTSDAVATIFSDGFGLYRTPALPAGCYTVKILPTEQYKGICKTIIILGDGHVMANQDIILSSYLNSGELRIVLEWGSYPLDLDSHLVGYATYDGKTKYEYFHVYFANKIAKSSNGDIVAQLDIDDTISYGPETVTIDKPNAAVEYLYYVRNFSQSPDIGTSNAIIRVYEGTGATAKYVFYVPTDMSDLDWYVFKYDPTTKKLSPYVY